jgi:hypothetical protein
MKKGITLAALAIAAALLTVGFASAAGTPHLSTFGTGDVFVNGDKAAMFVDAGEYGGVYRNKTSNKTLGSVTLSFVNDRAAGGGAPRFSIPIDENGDKIADTHNGASIYAFVSADRCSTSAVSTSQADCIVDMNDGTGPYANWAAFVAANPTWRVATKEQVGVKTNGKPDYEETMPFIVADAQGDYLVHDVVLSY